MVGADDVLVLVVSVVELVVAAVWPIVLFRASPAPS